MGVVPGPLSTLGKLATKFEFTGNWMGVIMVMPLGWMFQKAFFEE
jgi:hypothetical protein